jgi:DNA-binding NarL/FixJ family response regulator
VRLRVLLADDHAMMREGLAAILRRQPELSVVAEVGDGELALATLEREQPELAIVDVQMPRMTGIELLRRVRERALPTRFIVLSMHHEAAYVREALQAGALGYVVKESAPSELLRAVDAVRGGRMFLSSSLGLDPRDLLQGPDAEPHLTPRERDVLRLLAEGLSSKQIAGQLNLSVRTVENRRAAIMEKLQIHSVPGLVKYAIRNHLTGVEG